MKGIVLLSHGALARGLADAATFLWGIPLNSWNIAVCGRIRPRTSLRKN